jgi:integrase
MATLCKRTGKTPGYEIQFFDTTGRRLTIYLGGRRYSERTANELKRIVETLVYCRDNSLSTLDKRTLTWLESASPEIRAKLAKTGLVEVPPEHTVKEIWDAFLEQKELDRKAGRIKESTLNQYKIAQNRFLERFKESDRLTELSKEALTKWKMELLMQFKQATVASQLKHTKSAFTWAVEQGWIKKSPLDGIGRGSFVNKTNDLIVPMDWYYRLLDASPCQDWRTIIALVRIGGLRCPSEVIRLRWKDVLWDQNRFYVRSPKTEHHSGKESRLVPIFPELRTELETLFFDAESKDREYVINRYRRANQNLGTTFGKIVRRAGLPEIPRPFDNMRMTRSNEIYNRWGAFKESQWIGHSSRVRQDHYLMLTENDFQEASLFSTPATASAPKQTSRKQSVSADGK